VKAFLKGHPDVAVKPDVLTGGKGVKITGEHLHSAFDEIDGEDRRRIEEEVDLPADFTRFETETSWAG
jgi:phosphoribosylamine-glycine ligase